jgi:hypothetical protein
MVDEIKVLSDLGIRYSRFRGGTRKLTSVITIKKTVRNDPNASDAENSKRKPTDD